MIEKNEMRKADGVAGRGRPARVSVVSGGGGGGGEVGGFLAIDDRVESAVLVRLVLDRPYGAVRFDHGIEPGYHVAGPRLVLALHVARVRVVHVVMERIMDGLVRALVVRLLVLVRVAAVAPSAQLGRMLLLLLLLVRDVVVRRTTRPRDHTEQNAQLRKKKYPWGRGQFS